MTRNPVFFLLLAAFVFFGGCRLFQELSTVSAPGQPVAEDLRIGGEWREIIPPRPLRATERIHAISIKTPDVEGRNRRDKSGQSLEFTNGRTGRVEAVLYDDRGEAHRLQLVGTGNGFDLGVLDRPAENGSPARRPPDFPLDRTYRRLKIRSDVPFYAEKIVWTAEIQK